MVGVVLDACDPSGHSGWTVDGYGGMHPFGGASYVSVYGGYYPDEGGSGAIRHAADDDGSRHIPQGICASLH